MKKLNILFLSFILTACGGGGTSEPKEQQDFNNLVSNLSKEYKTVKNSDNELQKKAFEDKFKAELKDKNRSVASWVGSFVSATVHGNEVVIKVQNKDQTYHLVLLDPKAIEYAKKIKEGDKILFSGNLGSEASLTINGALNEPEFRFLPTKISVIDDKEGIIQDQKIIQSLKQKKEAEEKAFIIKRIIVDQCNIYVKDQLRFPLSANFLSNEEVVSQENNSYLYIGSVTSKNGLGNEIPQRFRCIVEISDEPDSKIFIKKVEITDK